METLESSTFQLVLWFLPVVCLVVAVAANEQAQAAMESGEEFATAAVVEAQKPEVAEKEPERNFELGIAAGAAQAEEPSAAVDKTLPVGGSGTFLTAAVAAAPVDSLTLALPEEHA